jgi:predicted amidohydrolase
VQVKRYLPTFGPFDEGAQFTAAESSEPAPLAAHRVGLQICYDTFFPEVSRTLALGGAELLVVISASPVTSGRMFGRLLPARAIENATPVVFANRVGVEDGVVFGGGSGGWDARGEPIAGTLEPRADLAAEEQLLRLEVDLDEAPRWRPFRPVLRDIATRPGPTGALPGA